VQDPMKQTPSLGVSVIPVVVLIISLFFTIVVLDGSGHIPLMFGALVAAVIAGTTLGMSWDEIQKGLTGGIVTALPAILILMIVGLLIGVWIASGVVPVMIYYGLKILSPSYFLVASALTCALISLATGSSWSTAATVGLALMGVGQALGMPPGMTAGAVISGAYFGDKMSPLSDTTNLAPAVAGTQLFTHIRHLVYTTVPALIGALLIFTVIGLLRPASGSVETADYVLMLETLSGSFNLTPWLLVAPAAVLFLVWRKTPALPALAVWRAGVDGVVDDVDIIGLRAKLSRSPHVYGLSTIFGEPVDARVYYGPDKLSPRKLKALVEASEPVKIGAREMTFDFHLRGEGTVLASRVPTEKFLRDFFPAWDQWFKGGKLCPPDRVKAVQIPLSGLDDPARRLDLIWLTRYLQDLPGTLRLKTLWRDRPVAWVYFDDTKTSIDAASNSC